MANRLGVWIAALAGAAGITLAACGGVVAAEPGASNDGMRLCAMRRGQCSCRAPEDGPGVFTPMPESRCAPSPEAAAASAEPAPPAINSTAATAAAPAAAPVAAPAAAPPQPQIPAAPVQSAAQTSDGMRLCAVRRGQCSCRAPEDGPGVFTPMPESRCAPSPESAAATENAAPQPAAASASDSGEVTKANVRDVQTRLKAAGYDPGPIDGGLGPKTLAAIKRFQTASGMPGDGRISGELIERLRRAPAKALAQPETRTAARSAAKRQEPRLAISPVTAAAPAPDTSGYQGMSNCALRNGLCSCKSPTDGVGEWTLVDNSRCKLVLFSGLSSAPATALPKSKAVVADVQRLLRNLAYFKGAIDGRMGPSTVVAIQNFQEAVGLPVDGAVTDLLRSRLKQLQPVTPAPAKAIVKQARAPEPSPAPAPVAPPAPDIGNTAPAPSVFAAAVPPAAYPPGARPGGPAVAAPAAAPAATPATASDYRLCAVRRGQCSCQQRGDPPGSFTPVEAGRCGN